MLDVATKLRFALEVFDHKMTGRISRENLVAVLGGKNALALNCNNVLISMLFLLRKISNPRTFIDTTIDSHKFYGVIFWGCGIVGHASWDDR